MAQIIIIEDEVLLAKSLARSLTTKGHGCVVANKAEDGLKMLEQYSADIVLMDLQLPGMTGYDAMKKIRQRDPDVTIIVITAYGTMASVIEAMRAGASDFLRKPIDTEELSLAIDRALANTKLKQTVAYYSKREIEKTDHNKLISNSPRMKALTEILEKLLAMDLPQPSDYPPVLIMGETGTGKDFFARILHFRSKYATQPFVEVDCSNLPKGLEEAELFGYEKGAFTGADRLKRGLFETADGGTIFLNELGNLNREAQANLLGVIEQKILRRVGGVRDVAVDVRVIAASNQDLSDKSQFREDLYHRLNNLKIEMPPLRERKEDIIELAELFLLQYNKKYHVSKELSQSAKDVLINYDWVGNIRELRHLIERVTFLTTGSRIKPENLDIRKKENPVITAKSGNAVEIDFPNNGIDLEAIEKEILLRALESAAGNVSKAARKLSIGHEALRYRIKKYSISKMIKIVG